MDCWAEYDVGVESLVWLGFSMAKVGSVKVLV